MKTSAFVKNLQADNAALHDRLAANSREIYDLRSSLGDARRLLVKLGAPEDEIARVCAPLDRVGVSAHTKHQKTYPPIERKRS